VTGRKHEVNRTRLSSKGKKKRKTGRKGVKKGPSFGGEDGKRYKVGGVVKNELIGAYVRSHPNKSFKIKSFRGK